MNDQKPIQGYLIDLTDNSRLEFQFNPLSISDSKSTNFATSNIVGLSHPQYQFVSGGARNINFAIQFIGTDVKKKCNWLKSLLYPEYNSNQVLKNGPRLVLFMYGDLYESLQCLVKKVDVTYKILFSKEELLPKLAIVDISLEEVPDEPISYTSVKS